MAVLALIVAVGVGLATFLLLDDDQRREVAEEDRSSQSDDSDHSTPERDEEDEDQADDEDDEDDEPVNPEAEALAELQEIADDDAARAEALSENSWTAQLASSAPTDSPVAVLDGYHRLVEEFPDAILVWSGDWPGSYPVTGTSWVVLSGDQFDTTAPVLAWCDMVGRDDTQCWAKRLSLYGDDADINTDRYPPDDRNN
ncbi:MAG: hypothetical protein QM621_13580 [Aeromicrobium sp.]|uniref:hypothetical protein n=1 Tax=Aeromicrobium sp. TaxID=1871063 RepID=UPI0039E494A5